MSVNRQRLYQDLRHARFLAKNARHETERRQSERQVRLLEMELAELGYE